MARTAGVAQTYVKHIKQPSGQRLYNVHNFIPAITEYNG